MIRQLVVKLKSLIGKYLITRILKIALNFDEEMIAAVIVSRYQFFLEDTMINYAKKKHKRFVRRFSLWYEKKFSINDG